MKLIILATVQSTLIFSMPQPGLFWTARQSPRSLAGSTWSGTSLGMCRSELPEYSGLTRSSADCSLARALGGRMWQLGSGGTGIPACAGEEAQAGMPVPPEPRTLHTNAKRSNSNPDPGELGRLDK